MPPLRSMPEITHTTSETEFYDEFQTFCSSMDDVAYIRLEGLSSGKTFHTFAPQGSDPARVARGLMMDGFVEPMAGEYFADYDTFRTIDCYGGTPRFEASEMHSASKTSLFSRIFKRMTN